jgi:hypothetical protein
MTSAMYLKLKNEVVQFRARVIEADVAAEDPDLSEFSVLRPSKADGKNLEMLILDCVAGMDLGELTSAEEREVKRWRRLAEEHYYSAHCQGFVGPPRKPGDPGSSCLWVRQSDSRPRRLTKEEAIVLDHDAIKVGDTSHTTSGDGDDMVYVD